MKGFGLSCEDAQDKDDLFIHSFIHSGGHH